MMDGQLPILIVAGAIFLILFLLIAAFSGPSVGKAQDRRLSGDASANAQNHRIADDEQ
jgi:hypothetical protein